MLESSHFGACRCAPDGEPLRTRECDLRGGDRFTDGGDAARTGQNQRHRWVLQDPGLGDGRLRSVMLRSNFLQREPYPFCSWTFFIEKAPATQRRPDHRCQ